MNNLSSIINSAIKMDVKNFLLKMDTFENSDYSRLNESQLKTLLNYIQNNITSIDSFEWFIELIIIFCNKVTLENCKSSLLPVVIDNPHLCAFLIINKNTPDSIINYIISKHNLNIVSKAFEHSNTKLDNQVLKEILILLNSEMWDNLYSFKIMSTRFLQDKADPFMMSVAERNIAPESIDLLWNVVNTIKSDRLSDSLKNNSELGNIIYLVSNEANNTSFKVFYDSFFNKLSELPYHKANLKNVPENYIYYFLKILKEKLSNNSWNIFEVFEMDTDGTDIIMPLINHGMPLEIVINNIWIYYKDQANNIIESPSLNFFINYCFNNNFKLLLGLPIDFFDRIPLSPEKRYKIEKELKPERVINKNIPNVPIENKDPLINTQINEKDNSTEDEEEEYKKIFSSKDNWFSKCSLIYKK